MESKQLPPDFKEFLLLLNRHEVEYLLIGGYAVGHYGYPRFTGHMEVWVKRDRGNAERLVQALEEFGFGSPELSPDLFIEEHRVTRMGNPPIRIEVLTTISGVEFDPCYNRRNHVTIDEVIVPMISVNDLLTNKRASNRHKDLEDVEHLERIVNQSNPNQF